MADTIIDFEDGLKHPLISDGLTLPWVATSSDAATGTFSLRSTGQGINSALSTAFIRGDFLAGTFSVDYKISSENNFDKGFILIDDVIFINGVSGAGSWTNFSTTLTAGFHKIEFRYKKDGSGNTGADGFFIDNLVLPMTYDDNGGIEGRTEFDMEDGLVPAFFDNTDTLQWVNSTLDADGGVKSLAPGSIGVSFGSSLLKFTVPVADKGLITIRFLIHSEVGFDKGKITIDGNVLINSGATQSTGWLTMSYYADSGAGVLVEMLYSKDGGGNIGIDAMLIDNISFGVAGAVGSAVNRQLWINLL